MQVNVLQLGMIGTNCYLFWDEDTKLCAVVDPGDHGERIAQAIGDLGLEPVAVLLTHSHFDHILGIPGLRSVWPELPVYCHPADIDERKTVTLFGSTFPTVSSFGNITPYVEGDKVEIGGIAVEVIHTPGHTPGSVTLKAEDVLFTGDTLFRSSIGRTDLEGGDFGTLMRSLKKLSALDGDWRVLPGHEGLSTLEDEKKYNGYLAQAAQM
jgi:glyoxylase-like metal-dependent hydrolase (beta-lactamase superfamily II)